MVGVRRRWAALLAMTFLLVALPAATATAQESPTLTLTPREAEAGSDVTAEGAGYLDCLGSPPEVEDTDGGAPSTPPDAAEAEDTDAGSASSTPPDAAEVTLIWDGDIVLDSTTVNDDGRFSMSITVPVDAVAGEHRVTAGCLGASDSAVLAIFRAGSGDRPGGADDDERGSDDALPAVGVDGPPIRIDLLVGIGLLVLLILAGLVARTVQRRWAPPSIAVTARPLLSDPPVLREFGPHPTIAVRLQPYSDPGIQVLYERGR